jgi:hypothetical protein
MRYSYIDFVRNSGSLHDLRKDTLPEYYATDRATITPPERIFTI